MGIRNRSKAYDVNDNLKPEYSIKINGGVYPLMSGSYKGFTSKMTKNGSTRFNKIFYGSPKMKNDYIKVNPDANIYNKDGRKKLVIPNEENMSGPLPEPNSK